LSTDGSEVPHRSYRFTLSATNNKEGEKMMLKRLLRRDDGQDIAEYAVMLAVILVLVIGTIRLVGSNANNAFSAVASSIQ
jgi:Flp pilus assembly pilin Flp